MNVTINKYSKKIIIFLLFLSFLLYMYNLSGWLIHDDEGGYLYQAWRISEGEFPYRDFYSPKMPLFLLTGSLVFKLFTPSVFLLRALTVLVTFLTAFFIFLIAKEVYPDRKIALLSSIVYLMPNVVFFQARFFRSDVYMVCFSVIALFLFIKAITRGKQLFFLLSGIFFGIAIVGFKLIGIIPAVSCLGYFGYQIFFERENLSGVWRYILFFMVGLLVTISIIFAYFYILSPNVFDCIFGHHLQQKVSTYRPEGLFPMLKYVVQHEWQRHYLLIFITLPMLIKYLFIKNDPKKVFSFITLSTPVILTTPYFWEILRYLLYVIPVVAIVFSAMVITLLSQKNKLLKILGILIIGFISATVFIPSLKRNYQHARQKEDDTLALAKYIRENTREDDFIVACYGSLPFYARRRMSYTMAAVSQSAVDAGRITAARLIEEIQDNNVKMILLHLEGKIDGKLIPIFGTDFGPYHLNTLIESEQGPIFMDFVKKNFTFLRTFNRAGQIFYIYSRHIDKKNF